MIRYRSEKQARLGIGVTMFIYAFFSTAYVQLTSPILSYIVEAQGYTDPILSNMIVTICCLAQIPACLVGVVLGKRMDKKLWSYIGMACFLVGSLLVILLSGNIYLVLLCRFVVGFGSGILIVLSTAILPDFYEGKSLSAMMGLVTSGSGFWGFVFSNVQANVCGAVGWKRSYLVHLYALIPLVLFILLVPGKPMVTPPEAAAGQGEKRRKKLAPAIFLYALLAGALVGAAMGFTAPTCLNLAIQASPENQVAAQAVTTIGFASGQFLSTYWRALVGHLGDGSLPGSFLITGWCALALLGVLCGVSLVSMGRKTGRQRGEVSSSAGQ